MNLELPVRPDDVIADKYAVERVIGQGAVGVVVAARHRQLGQQVALKFLRPELAKRLDLAERFRRQARAAAAVNGEHVCRVLDVCTTDGGVPYVVMECPEGRDLASELAQREIFPYAEAVDYVLQACEGLAEALVGGFVHCDLKPSKLYLTTRQDGSRFVKLLDLGTSELSNDTPANLHASLQQSAAPQSPAWLRAFEYLAPEQLESLEQVTPTTNVWALGAILYRLLSGRPPFRASSAAQFAQALRDEPVLTLVEPGCEVPEKLLAVVQRALAKRTSDRYPSIAELAQALAPFAPPRGRVSAERVSRLLPPRATADAYTAPELTSLRNAEDTLTPSRDEVRPRRARGRRAWLVLAALIPPAVVIGFSLADPRAPADGGVEAKAAPEPPVAVTSQPTAAEVASEGEHEDVAPLEQAAVAQTEVEKPALAIPVAPRPRAALRAPQLPAAARELRAGVYRLSDFGGRR